METKIDNKQEAIEARIDDNGFLRGMGGDMNAMLALNARISVQAWQANRFMVEFSESLGFKNHIDTAVRVLNYLYPKNNRGIWNVYDKLYSDRVKNSPWIKANQEVKAC